MRNQPQQGSYVCPLSVETTRPSPPGPEKRPYSRTEGDPHAMDACTGNVSPGRLRAVHAGRLEIAGRCYSQSPGGRWSRWSRRPVTSDARRRVSDKKGRYLSDENLGRGGPAGRKS